MSALCANAGANSCCVGNVDNVLLHSNADFNESLSEFIGCVELFLIDVECLRVAVRASTCPGQKPVCHTCLYASSEDGCRDEGYDEDASDMTNVSSPLRRQTIFFSGSKRKLNSFVSVY